MTNTIKAVRDHALANYGKAGWDFVVECWSDEEIAEAIGNARTAKAAIAKVKKAIAPLAERRDEVRSEIDWVEPVAAPAAETNWVAELLPSAARAAIEGKAEIDRGKAKGASALATMIAGFASDEAAAHKWAFDIKVNGDVHTYVECTGTDEFGNDDLAWKRNGEGKVSRDAQTAYKVGLQAAFFGVQGNPAVWTMASKAIPMARAIREEGMTATLIDGELKLSGGTGDRAKAMAEAKSLAALAKAAKGEAGSNRGGGHGAGSGEGDSEARVATPSEILAAAARLIEGVAKGEEALSNAALSYARKIAAMVASNPDAFAEA